MFTFRDNVILASRFVAGLDYGAFRDNHLVLYAVTRALEIISEASRRLPDDVKARHPELPWADIAGAGNIYRHDYEEVRESAVWITVQKHLPRLLDAVQQELQQLGSAADDS